MQLGNRFIRERSVAPSKTTKLLISINVGGRRAFIYPVGNPHFKGRDQQMRKNLYATVGLGVMCLCLASTTAYSQDSQNIWQLPNDVLGTGNQISFNQGANGVWYFMESSSLAHDPLTYRFLPNFTAPCSHGTAGVQTGVECWNNASDFSNFETPQIS